MIPAIDIRTVDSVVTFSCNTNYKLIGSRTRTCLVDGTWSGHQPTCTRKFSIQCPFILLFYNCILYLDNIKTPLNNFHDSGNRSWYLRKLKSYVRMQWLWPHPQNSTEVTELLLTNMAWFGPVNREVQRAQGRRSAANPNRLLCAFVLPTWGPFARNPS